MASLLGRLAFAPRSRRPADRGKANARWVFDTYGPLPRVRRCREGDRAQAPLQGRIESISD